VVAAALYVTRALAESELREFLANKLAQFEIPHYIHQQFEPLPRIASYKIAKRQLKAKAIERLGLGQVAVS
jgi:acyl-CoA synthetase (AMP-forming)/AMP-acid ligase II